MRIELNQDLKSRDGTLDKDGLTRNVMATNTASGVKADKRPGTLQTGAFAPTGTGVGIYAFGDYLYSWTGGNTWNTPTWAFNYPGSGFFNYPEWNSIDEYQPGDEPVMHIDDDPLSETYGQYIPWYPVATGTNYPPSSVNSPSKYFWSKTSIGSTRYTGTYLGSTGHPCGSREAAGYSAWLSYKNGGGYATCDHSSPDGRWHTYLDVIYTNFFTGLGWAYCIRGETYDGGCSSPNLLGSGLVGADSIVVTTTP